MTSSVLQSNYSAHAEKRRDWQIISLIGAVHASSHFFQLLLPTLYLSLAHEYGYDFARLGLLASVFFLVSCLGQASSGFVVDRIGPTPVLRFGLLAFIVSAILIAVSGNYFMLMLAAVIGGIGNSVFHPVDYSIINHRVSASRLGHAYSIHGLTGNLGWALTPVFMAALIHLFNWRVATFSAGLLVAIVLFLTLLGRNLLAGKNQATGSAPATSTENDDASVAPDLSRQSAWQTFLTLIAQPALWGAFLFFVCSTIALSAVQNFTIPLLDQVYGIDKVLAGATLSAYMLAGCAGLLAGGFLVDTTPSTERTVALALVLAGVFMLVLAAGIVGPLLAMILVGLTGFFWGLAGPSRDMLIRRVTPKGATGTVYGLVYSGMDVGSSVAPFAFGLLIDAHYTQAPWVGAALAFVAAAGLAMWVARAANAAVARSSAVSAA